MPAADTDNTTRDRLNKALTDKALLETERLRDTQNPNRIFYFNQQITDRTVETCIEVCERWATTPDPITIMFQCPGGSVFSGFALYDFIVELQRQVPVETCAFGYAASMAAVLVQSGTWRTITPNSYLMIHEAGSDLSGNTSGLRDQMALMEQLQSRAVSLVAAKSKVDVDFVLEQTRRKDWWMNADEALEHGFVDSIRLP